MWRFIFLVNFLKINYFKSKFNILVYFYSVKNKIGIFEIRVNQQKSESQTFYI